MCRLLYINAAILLAIQFSLAMISQEVMEANRGRFIVDSLSLNVDFKYNQRLGKRVSIIDLYLEYHYENYPGTLVDIYINPLIDSDDCELDLVHSHADGYFADHPGSIDSIRVYKHSYEFDCDYATFDSIPVKIRFSGCFWTKYTYLKREKIRDHGYFSWADTLYAIVE